MTAPLTPHDPWQTPHDPWQTPPDGGAALSEAVADHTGDLRGDVLRAVLVTAVVAVSGLLLGLLWLWLAPRVPLISDASAVFLKDTEGEEAVGADGTFVLLAVAFGLVSAVAVFLFRRRGGIALVLALAVGGLLGAVLAWKLGIALGPESDVVAHAKAVGKGVTFDAPLKLTATGAVLVWPVVSMIVYLALTALFAPRDPEPQPEWGWGAYDGPAEK